MPRRSVRCTLVGIGGGVGVRRLVGVILATAALAFVDVGVAAGAHDSGAVVPGTGATNTEVSSAEVSSTEISGTAISRTGVSGAEASSSGVSRSAATLPPPAVCSDDQGVLGSATCARITELLAVDEQQSSDEIAVLVIGSTRGQSIESYATRVFNSWGIGKEGADNGVLVVVAFDDRAMRIEVGSGLDGRLPDGQAREIVGGTMLPAFKAGEYRYGVLAGIDAVRVALGHPVDDLSRMTAIPEDAGYDQPTPARQPDVPPTYSSSKESGTDDGNGKLWAIVIAIGAGLALIAWLRNLGGGGGNSDGGGAGSGYSRRRSYRSFSSSSSSRRSSGSSRRSGFGGGRSSGGGASGRW